MYETLPIRLGLFAILVSTCAFAADAEIASANSDTYHSTVSEVRLSLFATDNKNHPFDTLTQSDFAVIDDELVVREFRSFSRANETALDVVILLDLSESVAPRLRFTLEDVTRVMAAEEPLSNDHLSVISFGGASATNPSTGSRPVVLCADACHSSTSTINSLGFGSGGATPLYDALIFGANFMWRRHLAGVRQVILLFSDGNDTSSIHTAHDALEAVSHSGALLYAVDVRNSTHHSVNAMEGISFLQQLSEATGARYIWHHGTRQENAAEVLDGVLADLRASYVVTYALPNHHPGLHSLRVLPTRNLNLTFHNRDSYDYDDPSCQ